MVSGTAADGINGVEVSTTNRAARRVFSGVTMGCAGYAMHEGPAVRGPSEGPIQWNQFFAFRYRMYSQIN